MVRGGSSCSLWILKNQNRYLLFQRAQSPSAAWCLSLAVMTPGLGWVARLLSGVSSETPLAGTQDPAFHQGSEQVLLLSQGWDPLV